MRCPPHFTNAEWNDMNSVDNINDTETSVKFINIKLPFRLQKRARQEFFLKFNPETKTNFYDAKYSSYYEKCYIMNFNKYSVKLSEKLNWDSEKRCYYYYKFETL